MDEQRWHQLKARGTREAAPAGHIRDCLIWPGATGGKPPIMYGVAQVDGKLQLLHRAVWQHFHPDEQLPLGRPPKGTPREVITHSCFRSLCYEPTHLVRKSQQENLLERPEINHWAHKQTRCKRNHDLSEAYVTKDGRRDCQACRRERRLEAKNGAS